MLVLLLCHSAVNQARVHLLVAFLLLAQYQLLLSVEQALSGLALAGHHELWGEVTCRLVGSTAFRPDHGLALYDALAQRLFVCFNSTHCWGLGGALSASIYTIDWHKVVFPRRRRLLRVVECLVLVEDFVLRYKDAVDGRGRCRGRPVQNHVLVASQATRFARRIH